MDYRALGAIATGFFRGQLANREAQRQAEAQALQELRQQQQMEFQRQQAQLQADQWQKTSQAQQDANKAAADRWQQQWNWEHGTGPGTKAGEEATAGDNALRDRLMVLNHGETGLPAYPDVKLKAYQQELPTGAMTQVLWPSQDQAVMPGQENVPYPGENGPETAPPPAADEAVAEIAKRKVQQSGGRPSVSNVEPKQDLQYRDMSHEQLLAELGKSLDNARPGTEASMAPTGGIAIGVKTPTAQQAVETQQAVQNLQVSKQTGPAAVRQAFADALVKESAARVSQATEADQIAEARVKLEQAREQVKATHNSASHTAAQERALMRQLRMQEKELELKEQQQAHQQAVDWAQVAVSRQNANTAAASQANTAKYAGLNFHLDEAKVRAGLAAREDTLSVTHRADLGAKAQSELSSFFNNTNLALTASPTQAAMMGHSVPTPEELKAKEAWINTLVEKGIFTQEQANASIDALSAIARRAGEGAATPTTGPTPGQFRPRQ